MVLGTKSSLFFFTPLFSFSLFFFPLLLVSFLKNGVLERELVGGFLGAFFCLFSWLGGWVERRIKRHSTHTRRDRKRKREKEAILLMVITLRLSSLFLPYSLLRFLSRMKFPVSGSRADFMMI
ncbi:hypothetical protein F5144DRAFT_147905 [Chaetomium tenue]|uniref:Uncharacterized protein n=1 Tax=Chaetomium tenue TaxID=1854479 RepID=A0ACB7PJ01_9PEZI|nr:hypothetical protein F5144DRAFT_147905 [Chaetomium globosum]